MASCRMMRQLAMDQMCIRDRDVGFGPENIGVPTDEIWQRVDYALRAVGMTKYRTHSQNKLSGGPVSYTHLDVYKRQK